MAINAQLIKDSAARIAPLGTQVTDYFYHTLFTDFPQVRRMFPAEMDAQKERLFQSLVYIASNIDNTEALVPYLQDLGAGHIQYDTRPEHYPLVGQSLMKTLAHFAGDAWTPEVAAAWAAAYNLAAQVMVEAAAKSMAPERFEPLQAS